jgi:AbrB family looped-hinge helix DNA binding protein
MIKSKSYEKGRINMTTATIGTRYQVVIPKRVRQAFTIRPNSRVTIEAREDCIVLYPENTMRLRGLGAVLADNTDATDYVKRLRAEWEAAK